MAVERTPSSWRGSFRLGSADTKWHLQGTLAYRGLTASEAVEALIRDDAIGHVEANRLHGGFAINVNDPKGSRILADSGALLHLFADADASSDSVSVSCVSVARMKGQSDPDPEAYLLCLACGFFPGSKTPIRGVRRIIPEETHVGSVPINRPRTRHTALRPTSFQGATKRLLGCINDVLEDARGLGGGRNIGLGLSGGYDSRLLLAAAIRAGFDLRCFSHFKRPPDRDLPAAQGVAAAAGVPLKVLETQLPEEMDDQELRQIAVDSLALYDAHVHVGLELPRVEYTPDYRNQVIGGCDLMLSGVGGELFRNHDHGSKREIPLRAWIEERLVGHEALACLENRRAREWVVDWFEDYLSKRLDLDSRKQLDLLTRRRFYAEVWLPEWHGLRNGVESGLGLYLAPFASPYVAAEALAATPFVGAGGNLEAAMINTLDPKIAGVQSSYGFRFDSIPLSVRLGSEVRSRFPMLLRTAGRLRRSRSHSKSAFDRLTARPGLFRDASQWLAELGLPVNWSRFGADRGGAMLALGLGCSVGYLQGYLRTDCVGNTGQ